MAGNSVMGKLDEWLHDAIVLELGPSVPDDKVDALTHRLRHVVVNWMAEVGREAGHGER